MMMSGIEFEVWRTVAEAQGAVDAHHPTAAPGSISRENRKNSREEFPVFPDRNDRQSIREKQVSPLMNAAGR
jgi:hypothetical protein